MSKSKVDSIINDLKELSLIEAADLVKLIEETFGVSASAPVAVAAAPVAADGGAAAAEEKDSFNIKLTDVPADKKIAVIKVVKSMLNIGLAEAKTLVESAPCTLMEDSAKDDANKFKDDLVAAGAGVSLE